MISNTSGGSKSSRLKKFRREGKMNLLKQKNAFVNRRHTQDDVESQGKNEMPNNHINLGMNMMSNDPQQISFNQQTQHRDSSFQQPNRQAVSPMNMSNINNVNVSFQFNIQPGTVKS
jgi:hypothetical protein